MPLLARLTCSRVEPHSALKQSISQHEWGGQCGKEEALGHASGKYLLLFKAFSSAFRHIGFDAALNMANM
jgi:hypothetical protein